MKKVLFNLAAVFTLLASPAEVTRDTDWYLVPDTEKVGNVADLAVTKTNEIEAISFGMIRHTIRVLPKYLHELEYCSTFKDDAEWYYEQADYKSGHCSSRRIGGFLERNYDWLYDESAEFVIQMARGDGRFASVGIANVGTNLTESFVLSRKWSRYYKCLPGHMLDGINENGVAVNINVTSGESGWRTSGEIHCLGAVRWVLDHGVTAKQAAEYLAANVYIPDGFGMNFHYMIADKSETWIVENGIAYKKLGVAVMTNYRLYPYNDGGSGQERYAILDNVTNRITDAWWTKAYERSTTPVRASDIGTDATVQNQIFTLWESKPREEHRSETFGGEGWWQTVHTSVYDITNHILRISVQEQDDWYTFALGKSGMGEDDVRRIAAEVAAPMTNDLAKTRIPSWLTADSEEPRGKTDTDVYVSVKKWRFSDGIERTLYPATEASIFSTERGWDGHSAPAEDTLWSAVESFDVVHIDELVRGPYYEPTGISADAYYVVEPDERSSLARTSESSGLAKFNVGGVLEKATPSSTDGEDADYRDPKDAKCYEDAFTEWVCVPPLPKGWYVGSVPSYTAGFNDYFISDPSGFAQSASVSLPTDTLRVKWTGGEDYGEDVIATRQRIARKGDTFVTHTFVTNEVATAKCETDTAISAETARAKEVENGIIEEISAFKAFDIRVMDSIPASGEVGVVYLVKAADYATTKTRDEYLWSQGAWRLIGSTRFDSDKIAKTISTTPIPDSLTNRVSYINNKEYGGVVVPENEDGSVVIGDGAVGTISPDYIASLASKTGNFSLRSVSVAIGKNAQATGGKESGTAQAIAIGFNAKSTGSNSIAIGDGAVHWYETDETGNGTVASASESIAFGYNAKAKASGAMQIGRGKNETANSLKFRDTFIVKDGKVQGGVDTNAVRNIVGDELDPIVHQGQDNEITVKSHAITTLSPTNALVDELYLNPTGTRNFEVYLPNTDELRSSLPILFDTEIEGTVTKLGPWWTKKITKLPAKLTMKEPIDKTLILEVEEYATDFDWTPVVTKAVNTNGSIRITGEKLHFTEKVSLGSVVLTVRNPLYGNVNVNTNGFIGVSGKLLDGVGNELATFIVE